MKHPSTYVSAEQTAELLASGAAARRERLQAADLVSVEHAAGLAGTSQEAINTWIDAGRVIGLYQAGRHRLPAWQFEQPLWDLIPALSRALGTTGGWAILAFLETPLDGLSGRTPRTAIEQGCAQRVLDLAAAP